MHCLQIPLMPGLACLQKSIQSVVLKHVTTQSWTWTIWYHPVDQYASIMLTRDEKFNAIQSSPVWKIMTSEPVAAPGKYWELDFPNMYVSWVSESEILYHSIWGWQLDKWTVSRKFYFTAIVSTARESTITDKLCFKSAILVWMGHWTLQRWWSIHWVLIALGLEIVYFKLWTVQIWCELDLLKR